MELLPSQNLPFVLIKRNVALDYLVRSQFKVSTNSPCFLCGAKSKDRLPSECLPRRLYEEKVSVFRHLLINATFRKKISPPSYNKFMSSVESCADCLFVIQEVYALQEQITKLETDLENRLEEGRAKIVHLKNGKRMSQSGHNKIMKKSSIEYESPSFFGQNKIQMFPQIKEESEHDFVFEDVEVFSETNLSNDEMIEEVIMPMTIDTLEHQASPLDVKKTDPAHNNMSCAKCGKTFTKKDHVQRHEIQVCKIRPPPKPGIFPCAKCGRIFDTRGLMHRHEIKVCKIREKISRKMAMNRIRGSFPCSKCAKILTTSAQRVIHEIKICNVVYTQEELDEMNITFHDCDQCDKSFTYLYDLRRHYTTHSEVKPHVCKCGKSYGHEEYLRKHQNFLCRLTVEPSKRIKYLQKKKLYEKKRKGEITQKSSGDVLPTQLEDASRSGEMPSGDVGLC
ncbi:zinc finger protein 250 isoform X2 [Folsomia candida]|nr:zinc finger protein 250 isoform X2 [Folsomia candida]XP_035701963.1 zinc finger protein 250 isoform X2 [Folsomia candida]